MTLGGLVILVIGARLLVDSATELARAFGISEAVIGLTIVAAGCNAAVTQGSGMALEVAARLETTLGPVGRWAFLIGFWCAVFAALV